MAAQKGLGNPSNDQHRPACPHGATHPRQGDTADSALHIVISAAGMKCLPPSEREFRRAARASLGL